MNSRLPETDLANWAFLSAADKRRALVAFEGPKIIKGSYEPFRQVFPDAVNQQFPLFDRGLCESDWSAIEQRLRQACKGNQSLFEMNRAILAATHEYAQAHGIAASAIDVVPLRFPGSVGYTFGLNLLIRYRDRASIIFLDMRRSNKLNRGGRLFMLSAMHHRFRIAYPDLAEAHLEIWSYRNNKDRTLVSLTNAEDFYSYDDLMSDVVETHEIWQSVRRGSGEGRRASGGSMGPLFD